MKKFWGKSRIKSSSALAISAGVAVAFMFIATIVSVVVYKNRMEEAAALLKEAQYKQYDSYVVLISDDDESDFWQQVFTAAKDYGQDNGVYVDLISQSVGVDYSPSELLEMAIASGADGVFLEGDNTQIPSELLAKAKKEGVTVITLETDVEAENRVSYIGVNSYSIANLYANAIVPDLSENAKIMIIGGSVGNSYMNSGLANNLQEAISGAMPGANIEYDIRVIDDNNSFATEEYIQNLFMENEVPPYVICLDAKTTTGFYQSMIDYNKVGQINLYGNYTTPTILTGIYHGVINSTVSIDAESMGKAAVDAFVEYRDTGYVSDYINVDTKIIDSSNVNDYIEN